MNVVILRALVKDFSKRFLSVADFALALQQALLPETANSVPQPTLYPRASLPPTLMSVTALDAAVRNQPNASKSVGYSRGRMPVLIGLALLVILAIFAAIGYGVYRSVGSSIHNLNSVNSSGSGSGGALTTQPPITTSKINQTVTYAGVDITIISVQQSTAFIDDSSTATNGMIRVNIKEANNSGNDASYFYGDIAHVILPDKTSVQVTNEKQSSAPAKSITRDNWLDFTVPTSNKIDQLTLVLGTNSEAQISIPLTGKANLSAFQTKTATLNIPISYGGVNWTLKTATSALGVGGKQASTGMHYVVLTFNLDNPTSSASETGFTSDYMRLKSGDATNSPTDSTLPSVPANTSGLSGTVTFLMPNNDNAFTLILLAIPSGIDPHSNVQVNTDFTI